MTIPPRFLDEIRSRVTLSEVIGKRVKLTRAGREFKGCCPFHNEKTPSFTVNDDKQFYHCFGCGAHGDVVNFMMQNGNLSFIDAVETLASEAGLQVPQSTPQEIERAKKQKDVYALLDDAAKYFEAQLHVPAHQVAHTYLIERGLSPETLASFRVGFAPDDGKALRMHLKQAGYSDAQMMEAGVTRPSTKGGDPYAFFRGRIMFPVLDLRGRVVAFGGRILPDHLRAPDRGDFTPPKYINSSETSVFDKGRLLYGAPQARQAAGDGHTVLVVEGYMDVIACHQAGVCGAVAPMGTALTEDQILALWKMIPSDEKVPVLCFDGDNAGQRAGSRACERVLPMLEAGQSVKFAFLPTGEDPDSLIKKSGRPAFTNILKQSLPLFDFIWTSQVAGRNVDTPEARAGLVKKLKNQISAIANRDVQSHYQALLQERISETFFRRNNFRGNNAQSSRSGGQNKGRGASPYRLRAPNRQDTGVFERVLMAAVLNYPGIYGQIEESFSQFNIGQPRLAQLRGKMIAALEESEAIDSEGLRSHLKETGFNKEMDDILCESVYVHAAFCRPGRDFEIDSNEITRNWVQFWQGREGQALTQEIQEGWRRAFSSSNEEEEEKLRHLVLSNVSEGE